MHLTFISLIGTLTGLATSFANAQGSGTSESAGARLIHFDKTRTVCIQANTPMYNAPNGTVIRTVGAPTDFSAIAITLDQNWIAIQNGNSIELAKKNQVVFNPC